MGAVWRCVDFFSLIFFFWKWILQEEEDDNGSRWANIMGFCIMGSLTTQVFE